MNDVNSHKAIIEESLKIKIQGKIERITDDQIHIRRPDGSLDIGSYNLEPSKTQQSDAADADINNIVSRYQKTGELPQVHQGRFGDLTAVPDYREMLNKIILAEDAFMALPAQLRKKFDNDPQQYINYIKDPANIEESYTLGLRAKPSLTDTQTINESLSQINSTLKSQTPKPKPKLPTDE